MKVLKILKLLFLNNFTGSCNFLSVETTNAFEKDRKLCKKQNKDLKKLLDIIKKLRRRELLSSHNKAHKLQGKYKYSQSCHIEPDWVLIWRVENNKLILERTGTHSKLY